MPIFDEKRNTYNVMNLVLQANDSAGEKTWGSIDFLSNGFKFRNNDVSWNANGGDYLWAAFAKNPFKYSNAR